MKIKDVIKMLLDDGWSLNRQKGAHRQFKHPVKKGLVTVSGKESDDIKKGTLGNIKRQADL